MCVKTLRKLGSLCLLLHISLCALAQEASPMDSISEESSVAEKCLETVVVRGRVHHLQMVRRASTLEWLDSTYLSQHFAPTFAHTLSSVPGVNVISIGSGYGKPVIRGLGFNRISYIQQGLKQEGQQWGADHGLEVDAYDQDPVEVIKGAGSLLYGSDALGGVIVRQAPLRPTREGLYGSLTLSGQSSTMGGGGSLLVGYLHGRHHLRLRMSGQAHGDRRVTTDSIVYLTRYIPIYDRRLKNSATRTYASQFYYDWQGDRGSVSVQALVNGEQSGFFPGAHGVPDLSRVVPDGSYYNIDLPQNRVRQLSLMGATQWRVSSAWTMEGRLGWQQNLRQERSLFHTHYADQPAPLADPDLELEFDLRTLLGGLTAHYYDRWGGKWSLGVDGQGQWHRRRGYGFLLPNYERAMGGVSLIYQGTIAPRLHLMGGLRYDLGWACVEAYHDPYLLNYLAQMGLSSEEQASYYYSSRGLDRLWHDLSGGIGISWQITSEWLWKVHLGRSFRLPSIPELTANGVHHGSFRHEVGDEHLNSERGWLLDSSLAYQGERWSWSLSPYLTYFSEYIYLQPSGEWSQLPHSGQKYMYRSSSALFAGLEVSSVLHLSSSLQYQLQGDYVYTYNVDEGLSLPFAPPARLSHELQYSVGAWRLGLGHRMISPQNRIARNEASTEGEGRLLDLRLGYEGHLQAHPYSVRLGVENLLDVRYYDHMSYYRRIGLPEAGRTIQLYLTVSL